MCILGNTICRKPQTQSHFRSAGVDTGTGRRSPNGSTLTELGQVPDIEVQTFSQAEEA